MEDRQPFPIGADRQLLLQLRSIVHPVRFIQTMAQKTKELAVFQVYILLVDAYFGVLDERSTLNIYDPGLTVSLSDSAHSEANKGFNPIDRLKPTSVMAATELDPRAVKVRQLLRKAMLDRFYKRYHPRLAYRKKVSREAQKKDFHFSYLIDIQAMFHPALSDGKLLHKLVFSFDDCTVHEKEKHYKLLTDYLWRTIAALAERVAFQLQSV